MTAAFDDVAEGRDSIVKEGVTIVYMSLNDGSCAPFITPHTFLFGSTEIYVLTRLKGQYVTPFCGIQSLITFVCFVGTILLSLFLFHEKLLGIKPFSA